MALGTRRMLLTGPSDCPPGRVPLGASSIGRRLWGLRSHGRPWRRRHDWSTQPATQPHDVQPKTSLAGIARANGKTPRYPSTSLLITPRSGTPERGAQGNTCWARWLAGFAGRAGWCSAGFCYCNDGAHPGCVQRHLDSRCRCSAVCPSPPPLCVPLCPSAPSAALTRAVCSCSDCDAGSPTA